MPPAGRYAMTFDDGPAEGSQALSAVLGELGARSHATHFMIGSYITRKWVLAVIYYSAAQRCILLTLHQPYAV